MLETRTLCPGVTWVSVAKRAGWQFPAAFPPASRRAFHVERRGFCDPGMSRVEPRSGMGETQKLCGSRTLDMPL